MTMLFYRADGRSAPRDLSEFPRNVRIRTWSPVAEGLPPRGSRSLRNFAWWAFARLGLFARPDFTEFTVWRGERMIHRLIVTPRWWRFPFMDADHLQLGDLWTHPDVRGEGIARAAIAAAHVRFAGGARCFWYVVQADNEASIRLIESIGYQLVGKGRRTSPFGIRAAGTFRLETPIS